MDEELEAAIAAEPWLPGDRIGRIWPSDLLWNFSADGRAIAKLAVKAFCDSLATPSKGEPSQ